MIEFCGWVSAGSAIAAKSSRCASRCRAYGAHPSRDGQRQKPRSTRPARKPGRRWRRHQARSPRRLFRGHCTTCPAPSPPDCSALACGLKYRRRPQSHQRQPRRHRGRVPAPRLGDREACRARRLGGSRTGDSGATDPGGQRGAAGAGGLTPFNRIGGGLRRHARPISRKGRIKCSYAA